MANSENTSDIIRGALQKAGEEADGGSPFHELALKYLNSVYLDIISGANIFDLDLGEGWYWARSRTRKYLTLKAPYETGNVTVTNNSTSITFSSAPSASLGSFKDRFLKLDDYPEYYRISAHTAGSASATLETEYMNATATASFKAIKLIYDLGDDVLRLVGPMRVFKQNNFLEDNDGHIFGIEPDTLFEMYPMTRLEARIPERFAVIYRNDVEHLVQFSAYPLEDIKLDFEWIPIPEPLIDTKTSIPIIPIDKRWVLEAAVAFYLLSDKEDEKMNHYYNAAKQGLAAMMGAKNKEIQHTSKQRGQLIPRADKSGKIRYRGVY